jgi:glutamyl-tRNA reductase
MHLIKVGVNYKIAPIEIREKMSFSKEAAEVAHVPLHDHEQILENVIISTCNRTEIYAVVENIEKGIAIVQQFLLDWFQLEAEQCATYLVHLADDAAIQHLFKLATGLDSLVVGETQILGQVKDAFLMAQEKKTTGKMLNELFKRVITFAKRSHHDTAIGEQAVSISYVAVELAKKIFGGMENKHVVILGAGETGELTLKNLQGAGVSNITVLNRTLERAEMIATTFRAQYGTFDQLNESLKHADIVISSTASTNAILTKEMIMPIEEQRRGRPLFLIDIAVPRDIDPEIRLLDHVFLYDLDDLQEIVNENMASRQKAAQHIERQLVDELASYHNWVAMLDAIPIIRALQEKSTFIQERTLQSIHRKIPHLTEREMKVLNKHTKSIVHQLLEEPIKQAKHMGKSADTLVLFQEIFGLQVEINTPLIGQK